MDRGQETKFMTLAICWEDVYGSATPYIRSTWHGGRKKDLQDLLVLQLRYL